MSRVARRADLFVRARGDESRLRLGDSSARYAGLGMTVGWTLPPMSFRASPEGERHLRLLAQLQAQVGIPEARHRETHPGLMGSATDAGSRLCPPEVLR